MTPFATVLSLHVVAAVLGLGPLTGLVVVASVRPRNATVMAAARALMLRFSLSTSIALAILLVTGVLVEVLSQGSFHETCWFRISFFLLIAVGALNGQTRRRLRKLEPDRPEPALRAVARLAWAMCALVAIVAVLMTAKPC